MFKSLRPILWTNQLDQTISFYTEILGFLIGEKNEDWGWASMYKDDVQLMLAKPNQHENFTRPTFTGSFYFEVDDVDLLWQSVKEKAKVCYAPELFEWGMYEFAIYDNNGYILQFGKEIEES